MPASIARPTKTPSLRFATTALGLALASPASVQTANAQTPAAPSDAVQLPPVSVEGSGNTGYQTANPTLPRLTEPLLDTPQSINVIPRQLIEEQNSPALRDTLRNVPGISLAAGEGGSQGDNLTLRGFTARNDIYLDGMRDFGSYTRDPFNLESVEVLKGPASVLFGRGSTGGVINQVSKTPRLAPLTHGTVTFGTDGTKRVTADIDRPIQGLDGAALRLNLMGDLNGVAGRNETEYRRFGFAPSVAFGLNTDTRLTISFLHQQEYDTPDYGLPWLYGSPAPVPRGNFYGFKDNDYYRTRADVGTVRVEHDVNDNVTLRNQFRYADYHRDIRVTEPQVIYTGITPATPLNLINVNRNIIAVQSLETFLQDQADATLRFSTGPFEHVVVTGIEVGRETSDPDRTSWTGVPSTNLLVPVAVPFAGRGTLTTMARTTSNTLAGYAVDTIKLGQHWELMAGVRWDRFETEYNQQIAPASHFTRTDNLTSWRAALVYKPVPIGSLYASAGTSFNPSAETLSLAASTADLAPEKNQSVEVGTKWDVNDGKLTLNAALFQIEKQNARVPDPNNPLFNILGGDQRVRGYELGAVGHLTKQWEVFSGYAFLDSEVVKSTTLSSVGRALANAPKHTFNLWTTYVLPWHDIQIGGGANYVSSRLASITPNSTTGRFLWAPGYVTFQAMARMPVRPGLSLQVNATNLTDVKFYDLLHPGHVVPGAGRAVLFSANFSL